jgi:D-tyrosyl-tRNA(Tyr) deacylase
MLVIIQRASEASVTINHVLKAKIGYGLVVLLGIAPDDTENDVSWLCSKIINLRIFKDSDRKMNRSLLDVKGELLIVSQFTLFASTKKGNRPSYTSAAGPDTAVPLYHMFIEKLKKLTGVDVKSGEFGADMQVTLTNDGPVTIIINSKDKK